MKRILIALIMLLSASHLYAQSTTVSGTVTDAGGQTWNNGSYSFQFIPSSTYPGPYTWTGGTLTKTITGSLNGSGAYTVSIPSSSAINPQGTSWTVTFCPQATSPCYTTSSLAITGSTYTLSPTPAAISINLQLPTSGPMLAYADAELVTSQIGSFYYNLSTQGFRICQAVNGNACTVWAAGGGGGGSGSVTSVAQTVPSWLHIGGSPITTSGTLAITAATGQTSGEVIGTCGAATSFAPCALTAGDLPSTAVTPGSYTNANITVNQQGQVTSAANGSGGSGTPCTTTASSIQYDASGSFGCVPDLTFNGTHTITLGASGILTITGTIGGAGLSTYLASPPAIGGTAPAGGAFTTLSASSTVSGTGFSTYLASPPAIGGTTAAAGAFTTLSASSTVSGTGFSTYLASPPAIGGTAPSTGKFTTLTANTNLDINGGTALTTTNQTGTGSLVLANSPTLVTPALGTPSAVVLTNGTGLPIAGITGLGTGVATALANAVSGSGAICLASGSSCSSGSPAFSAITSGTNATAAMVVGTGGSLTVSGSGTINATTLNSNTFANPGSIGSGTAASGAFTTISATGNVTFSGLLTTGTIANALCTDSSGHVISNSGANCISGGAGTVTVVSSGSLTSTAIVTGGGTTTLQTPSATSTLSSSGNMSLAGSLTATTGINVGSSPPSCGSATGVFCASEASTAGTPATGVDYMRANSTTHSFECSLNNGSETPCNPTIPTTATSGDAVAWGTWPAMTDSGVALTALTTGFSVAGGTTSKTLTVSNTLTLVGTDSTTMTFPSTSATMAGLGLTQTFSGTTNTFSGVLANSKAGAASTASVSVTGAPYTAGNATTNFPLVYLNDGTGPTTFSTAGTEFGINSPSGFTGNFLDFHVNGGASVASLSSTGALTVASCTGCGGGGGGAFPQTVSGTTTSGGIPYFSATTTLSSSAILNTNILVKGGGAGGAPTNSTVTDNGTVVSTTEPLTTSYTGTASQSALYASGAPYSGGSATTNFPLVYINGGSGPTTLSTSGTEFGINTPSGFTGNLLDFHVNGGASVASLTYTGALTVASCTGCSTGPPAIPIQLPIAVCQGAGVSIGGSGASATLPLTACTPGSSTTPQIGMQVYNEATVGTLYVDYVVTLPTSFTAVNDLVFTVHNDTATTGTDYINFQYACVASGSAVQPTYSSVQQISGAVPGTVGLNLKLVLSSPTITGCSANNIMYIRIGAGTGSGVFTTGNLDLTEALVEVH